MVDTKKVINRFPYEICELDSEVNDKLIQDFKGQIAGFVEVGPEKYILPRKFMKEAHLYYNVEIRPDDIWVVTFPRSGTTLMQELVWLINNNLDYEEARRIPLNDRFPFFEIFTNTINGRIIVFYEIYKNGLILHEDLKNDLLAKNCGNKFGTEFLKTFSEGGWEVLPKMKSPRFIKTHLPLSLLPKDTFAKRCKIVYVMRNLKDVAVSYFYLHKLFRTLDFQGDFEKFWNYFESNKLTWSPYWSHIKEGWKKRNDANVLFLLYEDFVQDIRGIILKLGNFFGKTLTDEDILGLETHIKIENFKNNPSIDMQIFKDLGIVYPSGPDFVRNGKINGNKEEYSEILKKRALKLIEANVIHQD